MFVAQRPLPVNAAAKAASGSNKSGKHTLNLAKKQHGSAGTAVFLKRETAGNGRVLWRAKPPKRYGAASRLDRSRGVRLVPLARKAPAAAGACGRLPCA